MANNFSSTLTTDLNSVFLKLEGGTHYLAFHECSCSQPPLIFASTWMEPRERRGQAKLVQVLHIMKTASLGWSSNLLEEEHLRTKKGR